jgi:predicted nucleotidyltransferase
MSFSYGLKPAFMMADRDRRILEIFAAQVRQHFPKAYIWAFGSRARGDATWESDLDICVVVNDLTYEDRHTIGHIAWEVGFENETVITTVCFTKEEFGRGPMSESTLVINILREGLTA